MQEIVSNKIKSIVFGGSYNPVHLSHEEIAKYCINNNLCDEVWLQPCYQSAWGKTNVDPKHRLNMCRLVTDKYANMKTSDWEIETKAQDGTYITIMNMQKDFPDRDFFFIIGQDNANKIDKFKNYEKLVKEVKFIVVPRMGIPVDKQWYLEAPHHYLNDCLVEGISSSEFRNMFKNDQEQARKYLDKEVYDYIISNNLYQGELS